MVCFNDISLNCVDLGEDAANRLLRSFSVLNKMAANAECLSILFQSLTENIQLLVKILQETNDTNCHSAIAVFLHNLLKANDINVLIDSYQLSISCCQVIKQDNKQITSSQITVFVVVIY